MNGRTVDDKAAEAPTYTDVHRSNRAAVKHREAQRPKKTENRVRLVATTRGRRLQCVTMTMVVVVMEEEGVVVVVLVVVVLVVVVELQK